MKEWTGIPRELVNLSYIEYCKLPELSKILQPFWYEDSEDGHIACLLDRADFPYGAHIIDIGSGTGETARRMKEHRPDLNFTLLNFCEAQLRDSATFNKICASSCHIPVENRTFDGAMFHASLCNMIYEKSLCEAVRVLKPGGVLFLNEPERVSGDNVHLERILFCRAYGYKEIVSFLNSLGMTLTAHENPDVKRYYLKDYWKDDRLYEIAFDGVIPGLWRFKKEGGLN